jgi:hypothetical protein
MVRRWSGSHRVTESVPGHAMISNGPRLFSDSFLDGQVVQMFLALTKACLLTLKLGAGVHWQSVRPW